MNNNGLRSFSAFQKKTLAACFIVYFCTYIGRLNMSATLGNILSEMHIEETLGGMLQTLFAVTYAAGQLVFGMMADRFEPRKLIFAGLTGSAACNLLFSLSGSFYLCMVIWTLNGIFQAMIWTPIVLIMAYVFDESRRKSASLVMSFTLALGHLAAWALAMGLARALTWRWSYAIPALVLLATGIFALTCLPLVEKRNATSNKFAGGLGSFKALWGTGLVFVLLCCITNGFVRDGVITWAPTILTGDSEGNETLFSLLIPCINLLGILLGAYLVRHVKSSIRMITAVMMAAIAVPAFIAFVGRGMPVYLLALMLGLISAILYGANPLLTTLIPMEYDYMGRVGLVAGLTDCSIYIGSSLAGVLTGWMHDTSGSWQIVYLVWTFAAVVGGILGMFATRKAKQA